MIEYRCPVCAALAYSAARGLSPRECPACGADLEEVGVAGPSRSAPATVPMNASVHAVRESEGSRG